MRTSLIRLVIADQKRLIMLVLSLLAINLLLWGALLWPVHQMLTDSQTAWTEKRRQLQQPTGGRQPDPADVRERWNKLPQRHELPGILAQVYDLAGKSGVSLTALSYKQQPATNDGLTACTLTCTASGRYAQLKRFLAKLQHLPGMANVERISINSPDPFQEQLVLDVQVVVQLRAGGGP